MSSNTDEQVVDHMMMMWITWSRAGGVLGRTNCGIFI